jgi:hypothetical protein
MHSEIINAAVLAFPSECRIGGGTAIELHRVLD